MGPHGPEMYQKTVHKVGLYASMQFKNGSDVTICLLEEKLVKPEVPVLEEEHTAHEKRVWEETSTHGYNLRPRPTKRNQRSNMVSIGQQSTVAKPHLHVMLNQVGIREGLKMFGEKGNNALLKELNQLHERDALLPKKKEDMTHDERKKALRYLMFLKEKRDGTIKARGCADRRSQREYTTKVETSLPTVSLEAMMMACAIDTR